MTTLSNAEKAQIINQRIKNLNYTKYNYDLDLVVENTKAAPLASAISTITTSISDINAQIAALTTELAKYPVEQSEE
jgi:hypothetical protein